MMIRCTLAGDKSCARPFLAITALLGATGLEDSISYDLTGREDLKPKLGCMTEHRVELSWTRHGTLPDHSPWSAGSSMQLTLLQLRTYAQLWLTDLLMSCQGPLARRW